MLTEWGTLSAGVLYERDRERERERERETHTSCLNLYREGEIVCFKSHSQTLRERERVSEKEGGEWEREREM